MEHNQSTEQMSQGANKYKEAWAAIQESKGSVYLDLAASRFINVTTANGKKTFHIGVRTEALAVKMNHFLRKVVEADLESILGSPVAVRFSANGHAPLPPDPNFPRQSPAAAAPNGRASPPEQPPPESPKTTENEPGTAERGPGRPPKVAKLKGSQISIDFDYDSDPPPLRGFVPVSNYAMRFWLNYLDQTAFLLWVQLRQYGYYRSYHNSEMPSITILASTLGRISRSSVTGAGGRDGAIQRLEEEGICQHDTDGEGCNTVHIFSHVRDWLPFLTPKQVATLPKGLQAEHKTYLGYYKGFNYAAWEKLAEQTLVGFSKRQLNEMLWVKSPVKRP